MKLEVIVNSIKYIIEYCFAGEGILNCFIYDKCGNSCYINITYNASEETDLMVNIKKRDKIENRYILWSRFLDRSLRTFIKDHSLNINVQLLEDIFDRCFIFNAVIVALQQFNIYLNIYSIVNDEIDLIYADHIGCLVALEMSCKNLSIEKVLSYINLSCDLKNIIGDADVKRDRAWNEIRPINIINHHKGNTVLFNRGKTSVVSTVEWNLFTDVKWNFSYEFRRGSRRDIGHSYLIRNAFAFMINNTISIDASSKVHNCNGSSSMGAVCGISIGIYNIGVMAVLIGGITIGAVLQRKKMQYCVDLTAEEDMSISCMDGKFAGTSAGFTAAQIDFKFLYNHDLKKILSLAMSSLKKVIKIMKDSCFQHKQFLSFYQIPSDRIGVMIGSNGKNIKQLSTFVNGMVRINSNGVCIVRALKIKLFDAFFNFYTKALEHKMYVAFVIKEPCVEDTRCLVTSLCNVDLHTNVGEKLPEGTCVYGQINAKLKLKIIDIIKK